jgi:CheY-like chemotaxis protein
VRIERISPALVRRAVQIYMRHAWPPDASGRPRVEPEMLDDAATLDEVLDCFEAESGHAGSRLARYTFRLGNHRYPFMKFVLQEHLVDGEFFFSVDTHDDIEIRPDSPDYAAWDKLKKFNRALKLAIEADWDLAGLPTNADLRALAEELARVETEDSKRMRLLLVDDEADVALGLQALLRARGYWVELARDGQQALTRLAVDPLPDLVLLDYEMPELDGEEVLARLRREERTAHLPVLMATASQIDLSRLQRVSGVLRKPYPRAVLFEMIERLLRGRTRAAER